MNTVIEQIRREDQARVAKDQARYAELLVNGNPAPDEVLELRGLMERLGKTHEQLQTDHNDIQHALRLERNVEDGSGLDEQIQLAERVQRTYHEQSEKIQADRLKEKNRLGVLSSDLQSKSSAAKSAADQLRHLVNLRPDLLGDRHPQLLIRPIDPNRPLAAGGVVGDLG